MLSLPHTHTCEKRIILYFLLSFGKHLPLSPPFKHTEKERKKEEEIHFPRSICSGAYFLAVDVLCQMCVCALVVNVCFISLKNHIISFANKLSLMRARANEQGVRGKYTKS